MPTSTPNASALELIEARLIAAVTQREEASREARAAHGAPAPSGELPAGESPAA